jgi:hypothetical protein
VMWVMPAMIAAPAIHGRLLISVSRVLMRSVPA